MSQTTPPTITPSPTPPQRNNRATFSTLFDAFVTWIASAVAQFGAVAQNVYDNAVDAYNSSMSAATQAGNAQTQAVSAANSATTALGAVATSGAIAWESGTTYSTGNLRYSLINFATYRRKTNGAGTIDPSLDKTNWASANAISGGEIGQLFSFSSIVTGNTITSPNAGEYLKAGVQVSRTAALTANYDVAQLETMGACSPYSGTTPFAVTSITFGAGLFCIVGAGGQVATSPDGITWTTRTSGTTDNLNVVEYLNGQFVAAGTAWLGASTDGITWNTKTAPANTNLKSSIAYINGNYVITSNGGSGSAIMYSSDLVSWSATNTSAAYPITNSTAYFSGKFYFCNQNNATVAVDLEGAPKISDAVAITGYMASLNGKLFKFPTTGSVGRVSSDGVTWSNFTCSQAQTPQNQNATVAAYGNSIYVATNASSGGMQSSADGISWTNRTASQPRAVVFLGGQFLTIGGTLSNNIHTSTDGITWTLRTPNVSMKAYAIAYSGSMYVAVGSNTGGTSLNIASSPDGITWTNRVNSASGTYFFEVAYGGGKFVAISDEVGQIYTSSDGITWGKTNIQSVVDASVGWCNLKYLNGNFIVSTVGSGITLYSTNAATWNSATVTHNFSSITSVTVPITDYQGGKYWGIGGYSIFYSFADTVSAWNAFNASSQYPATTVRIKSDGSKLIAIGAADSSSSAHLHASGDGIAWLGMKKPADLTAPTTIPSDFHYANGKFVFTVANKIVTSTNGLSWTSNAMSANTTAVYGISYGAGVWWFTGNNGYAYTSTDLATFALRYGAGTTPLTTTPVKAVYGNSLFIGANLATGTSVAITPDGVGGNIGIPVAPTNPVGTTFYLKVK